MVFALFWNRHPFTATVELTITAGTQEVDLRLLDKALRPLIRPWRIRKDAEVPMSVKSAELTSVSTPGWFGDVEYPLHADKQTYVISTRVTPGQFYAFGKYAESLIKSLVDALPDHLITFRVSFETEGSMGQFSANSRAFRAGDDSAAA